jgi:hypothetical protein
MITHISKRKGGLLAVVAVLIAIGLVLVWLGRRDAVAPIMENESTTDAARETFVAGSGDFSFSYPKGLEVVVGNGERVSQWRAGTATLGRLDVTVTVPREMQPNTNFSDARFTVGSSDEPNEVSACLTDTSGAAWTQPATREIGGVTFVVIQTGDAGAGNFYDTTSYRIVRDGRCHAIEYTIHSTNIGNYPVEAGVTEFDRAAIRAVLESMVESFRFL